MNVQYLLGNCSGKISLTGKAVKGVAYDILNTNKRNMTIAIFTTNYTGRIYIQGTLKDNPQEDDWFNIELNGKEYLEYNNIKNTIIKHDNDYYTIEGSYTYLRAKMDRDYIKFPFSEYAPYDYVSGNYIIDANVDMNQGFAHNNYPTTPLNPKDDPIYCKDWKPNYTSDYHRSTMLRRYGNVEKITLCY